MSYEHNAERRAPSRAAPARTPSGTHKRKKKKNNKLLYYVLLLILLVILAFSSVKIISYLNQQRLSEKQQSAITDQFITPVYNGGEETSEGNAEDTPATDGSNKTPAVPEPEQISVDFDKLCAKYPDTVGYIYGANTGISYPIVKGSDNDFYLNHDYDGKSNNNGSIFMEYLCNGDFSSGNSIIYGHHMKSGLMFAHLANYKSQSYYDAHPYFYIYTPSQNYRLDLFAGCVVAGDADIYALDPGADTIAALVSKSTFKSKIGTPTGKIVTLSTCDYTYDDARYVVLGQLVPIS